MKASVPHAPRVAVPPGGMGTMSGGMRGRPMANISNTLSKEATALLLKQRDQLRAAQKDQAEKKWMSDAEFQVQGRVMNPRSGCTSGADAGQGERPKVPQLSSARSGKENSVVVENLLPQKVKQSGIILANAFSAASLVGASDPSAPRGGEARMESRTLARGVKRKDAPAGEPQRPSFRIEKPTVATFAKAMTAERGTAAPPSDAQTSDAAGPRSGSESLNSQPPSRPASDWAFHCAALLSMRCDSLQVCSGLGGCSRRGGGEASALC